MGPAESVVTLTTVTENSLRVTGLRVLGPPAGKVVGELILLANISGLTRRACPLRIMCMISYRAIIRRAAWNSRRPCLAFTRRLIAR